MNAALASRADMNVLVIDDSVQIQKLIKSTLSVLGIRQVSTALDGQEALKAVDSKKQAGDEPFSLIICDWDMPVMDGITFIETFRKTDKNAVVIMVTARTSTADFNQAKIKGADYFFMKPLDLDMLKIRLAGALDAANARS